METYERKEYLNFFLQSCESKTNDDFHDNNDGDDVNACENNGSESVKKRNKRIRCANDSKDNNDNSNNDKAYYLYHYPNLCINRYGRWMDTNIVYPMGPNKCIVEFEWYVEQDMIGNIEKEEEKEVEKKKLYLSDCLIDSEMVQIQDIHLCERVQRGLNSTAYKGREGRYAPKMEGGKLLNYSVLLFKKFSTNILIFFHIFFKNITIFSILLCSANKIIQLVFFKKYR